jgi:ribonuclease P protein component
MDFVPAWPPRVAARWLRQGAFAAASGSAPSPAIPCTMLRLKQRADFLAAAGGAKIATAAFVLQGRHRDDEGPARVGFTVSRKVGTAVERNRVRRRLREVVRCLRADALRPGYDYVLVGRRTALNRPFEQMIEDFTSALRRLERQRSTPPHPISPARGGAKDRIRAGEGPAGGRQTGR